MSKKKKQIIIIGAVLLLLIVALVVLLLTGNESDAPIDTDTETEIDENAVTLIDTEVKDLSSLEITTTVGTYSIKQTGESTDTDGKPVYEYSIKEYDGLPVNTVTMNNVAEVSTQIFANSIIEENSERLKEFGLDKPSSIVKQKYFDGKVITLNIGNETPTGDTYYVTLNDETTIYEVASAYVENYLNDKTVYLDRVILPSVQTYPTIDELTVTRKDLVRPVKIVPQSDNDWAMYKSGDESVTASFSEYKMISPVETSLDIADQSGVTYSLWGLTASTAVKGYPTADEIEACGFEDPYCTVELIVDGEKTRLVFGSEVGVKDENGNTFRYAMLEGRDIIYSFNESDVYYLTFKPDDVITRMITSPYIYNLSYLKVNYGGKEYKFNITANKEDLKNSTFEYNGTNLDGTNFREFYQYIHKSMVQEITYDKVEKTPDLTIEYGFIDSSIKPLTAEFYTTNTRTVYVGENKEVKFTTSASFYERLVDNLNKLTNGEKIILAW